MALDRLLDGYRRFRAQTWPAERARYEALAKWGQQPDTLVIACSDSRVDPATVFGAVPGEMFVVRNVAGLVPTYQPDAGYHGTSAALEYAVRVLRVSRIVVLGHAQCGGVRAMVEGAPAEAQDFVAPWIAIAAPALRRARLRCDDPRDDIFGCCEIEVVRLSLANLVTFPWIADAVAAGALALEGFRFDIHTGVLERLEESGVVKVT
jgi:carbonic anhydrase